MKRLSLHIAVSLLTFMCGVTTAHWFNAPQIKPAQIQSQREQETAVSLNGLWLMGNASGGDEAGTIIRFVQDGQQVQGIIEQPSIGYGANSGVKKGDIEFAGTLEGNILRGQVHSYSSLEFQATCPREDRFMLKNFEMTLSEDGNLLDGWADNSLMNLERCMTRIDGRTTYTFRRMLNE